MHRQFQISPGVYVTDFRQNCQLKGIDSSVKVEAKDVGLILDKVQANQSKIKQLLFSNDIMKEEQDWESDQIILEAIEENYSLMIKFSGEMKEWIVDLYSLKYKPESDKIQDLINPERIQTRQNEINKLFNEFQSSYGRCIQKHSNMATEPKKEVQVSSDSENEDKIEENNNKKGKKQKVENKKQAEKQQKTNQLQNEGIYL